MKTIREYKKDRRSPCCVEEIYGVLESKDLRWCFLDHKCMKDILKHREIRIAVAVRRNMKLYDVLEEIYTQDNRTEEFLDMYFPYPIAQPEKLKSRIEQRDKDAGYWRRRF